MTTTVQPTQAATAVQTWLTAFSDALASNDTSVLCRFCETGTSVTNVVVSKV